MFSHAKKPGMGTSQILFNRPDGLQWHILSKQGRNLQSGLIFPQQNLIQGETKADLLPQSLPASMFFHLYFFFIYYPAGLETT